jgi:hypothetical protein
LKFSKKKIVKKNEKHFEIFKNIYFFDMEASELIDYSIVMC